MKNESASLNTAPAQSETPRTPGNSTRENRETPGLPGSQTGTGRSEKAVGRTSDMHGLGESDERVVSTKCSNRSEVGPREGAERSRSTKENTEESPTHRTQRRVSVSQGLAGVRKVARQDKKIIPIQECALPPYIRGKSRVR